MTTYTQDDIYKLEAQNRSLLGARLDAEKTGDADLTAAAVRVHMAKFAELQAATRSFNEAKRLAKIEESKKSFDAYKNSHAYEVAQRFARDRELIERHDRDDYAV